MKIKKTMLGLVTAGVIICALGSARAAIITQPTGLTNGAQYRLVFATSNTIKGTIVEGGYTTVGEYNDWATTQATNVAALNDLSTTWKAIISFRGPDSAGNPTTLAKDNTGTASGSGVAIYNLAGLSVATGNADLWDGTIANAINVTEKGDTLANGTHINTGTLSAGGSGTDYWMGKDPGGNYMGLGEVATSSWVQHTRDAGTARPIYVMSGIITAIPEPSTLSLVGLLLAGFVLRRRIRK